MNKTMTNVLQIRAALLQRDHVCIRTFDHVIAPYFDIRECLIEAHKNERRELAKYLMYIYVNYNDDLDYLSKKNQMIEYCGSVEEYHKVRILMHSCESLAYACMNNNLSIVDYKNAANACAHACHLQQMAMRGDLNMVKYFVALGADIHAKDDLALRWARQFGHDNVVQYLEKF